MKKVNIAGIHPAYFEIEQARGREVLMKASRPYLCIDMAIRDDLIVSIPFLSNMKHQYGFKLSNNRGLDYSKMLLVDSVYLVDLGKKVYYQDFI
jgi:hypothetical protein